MSADKLTAQEATNLGAKLRDYGNPAVGCFAAELAGESYPFSAAMSEIMLKDMTDEQLGRRFAEWCDQKTRNDHHKKGRL